MTLRVGVLGAGWVARERHLPAYRSDKRAEVVAVYDRDASQAEALAKTFGVRLGTNRLDAFFSEEIDLVSVCSSPMSHARLSIEALSQGCHVLTEKPMAMNIEEAIGMRDAAERFDRRLCVVHNFLFSRAMRQADKALASAGPVQYVAGLQLSSDRRRLPVWRDLLPAGLLFDELPHLLYMTQHFLGPLTLEGAHVSGRDSDGHPTQTVIRLRGPRGAGQAAVISGSPVSEWHVSVIARDRLVDIDLFRDIAIRLRSDRTHGPWDVVRTSARAMRDHFFGFIGSGSRLLARRLSWGHNRLIKQFLDAVEGTAPVPVDLAGSIGLVALTDEILAALRDD